MQSTALIMCSSGTTGLPKGVKLSHTHLLYKSTYIWDLTQDETLFCFSSIFWLTGICCLICGCLAGIKRIITNEPFTPLFGLQILEKYKVTCLFSAPIHMSLMSQHPAVKTTDFSAIRTYLTGGACVSVQLKDRMESFLPNGRVLNCYALTEICGVVSLPGLLDRAGSCGALLDGSKVKVIDDEGESLGPEQLGEFYAKTMFSFLVSCTLTPSLNR
jgi:4-coumarate--CoA ligase